MHSSEDKYLDMNLLDYVLCALIIVTDAASLPSVGVVPIHILLSPDL